jgi:hypothetical protein
VAGLEERLVPAVAATNLGAAALLGKMPAPSTPVSPEQPITPGNPVTVPASRKVIVLEDKIARLDTRIESVEEKLDGMEKSAKRRIDEVSAAFETSKPTRQARLEARLTRLETKLDTDQEKLEALGVPPEKVPAAGNAASTPAADQVTLASRDASSKAKAPARGAGGGEIVAKM